MSDDFDVDHDDIATIRKKLAGGERSIAARRAHEARTMSYGDRRRGTTGRRTEQTNIKLTPADKKRLLAICLRETEKRGLPASRQFTLTEFVEEAMDLWELHK